MILYFADRKFNILGMASTGQLAGAVLFFDNKEVQEIDTGTATLEGYLAIENNLKKINQYVAAGNYIILKDEDKKDRFFTIIQSEKDRKNQDVFLYAEDAGLDLLNEVFGEWEAPGTPQPASFYVNKVLYDSGFEIGLNEISNLTRNLSWEGEATGTARLLSIATQFDNAEVSYSFEIENMKVVKKYVNLYKKRGNQTEIELRLDRDIDNIVTSKSIENLATALNVKGGMPEGEDQKPITLKGFNFDDGDIYTDGVYLKSRSALAKWSRYNYEQGADEGHIVKMYSYDTLSQSELCNRALTHLKKISQIEVNYQVSISVLPPSVRIGDTINIVDDEDELYLEARVLKLERSRSNNTNIATLGEYLIKNSGINQRLQDLADKINTIQLKPGDTFYPWVRYADDDKGGGISSIPLNKSYLAIHYEKNNPVPSDDPSVYKGLWTKILGPQGNEGPPGVDGSPTYTWIMYADTMDGKNMSSNAEGKNYLGIAYNKKSLTPSMIAKDYSWSAMYDNVKLEQIKKEIDGITYPVVSYQEPEKKIKGMQWWQTQSEDSKNIIGYFVWDGTNWQAQSIQQSILNIVELNAVTINSAQVNTADLNGAKILNSFAIVDQGARLVGTTKIQDAKVRMEYLLPNNGQSGHIELNPQGLQNTIYGSAGDIISSFSLQATGLLLRYGNKQGSLTYESLIDNDWVEMKMEPGYTWYGAPSKQFVPKTKKVYIQNKQALRTSGTMQRESGTTPAGATYRFATWNSSDFKINKETTVIGITPTGAAAAVIFTVGGGVFGRSSVAWSEIKWDGFVGIED